MIVETVWFIGLVIFSIILLFGNNPGSGRGIWVKIGALFLIFGYSGLTKEYYLSFYEIEALTWIVRLGVTFLLFDLAIRTKINSPKQMLANVKTTFGKLKRKK